MTPRILIENLQDEKTLFRGYKSFLRGVILHVLSEEGFLRKAEVSVSLVTKEEIRRLNHEFRGVDRETDVLSFPLEDEEDGVFYLGDIILCPAVIESQAKEFGTTFRQELCLMTVHSTLHLLGWDHVEEKEKAEMFARQESLVLSLGEGEIVTQSERNV